MALRINPILIPPGISDMSEVEITMTYRQLQEKIDNAVENARQRTLRQVQEFLESYNPRLEEGILKSNLLPELKEELLNFISTK